MEFNFRNLSLYKVHEQPILDLAELQQLLTAHQFTECGDHEMRRIGFSSPGGRKYYELIIERHGHLLLRVLRQEKILPASVVNEVLEERCSEFEEANGFAVPRRERIAIKEKVIEGLMPQAFKRTSHVDLWWDVKAQRIGVFTSSRKRADECLDLLRQSLGSLKITPLCTKNPASIAMTQWIIDPGTKPSDLTVGEDALITGKANDSLRVKAFDLDSEEIQTALASNRFVSQISLAIEGEISFTLCDDMKLKGITFADCVTDEIESMSEGVEDHAEYIRVEFGLLAVTLYSVIQHLINWMGGEPDLSIESFGLETQE